MVKKEGDKRCTFSIISPPFDLQEISGFDLISLHSRDNWAQN